RASCLDRKELPTLLQRALLASAAESRGQPAMKPRRSAKFRNPAAQFFLGTFALAVVTAACFFLQIDLAATAFCYLVVILLFSLVASFLASGLLPLVAIAALAFFFAPPIFDFRMAEPQDRMVILPFLLASLIGSGLIQQARSERATALRARAKPEPREAEL